MTETRISRPKLLLIVLLIALFAAYVVFQARHVIRGPILTVAEPSESAVIEGPLVTIRGSTDNAVNLLISGRKVLVNEEGAFEETLPLPLGYSVMTIEAEDRYGRTVAREFELMRIN